MQATKLKEALNYPTAAREHRLKAARWLLDHPECLRELLHLIMEQDNREADKASWALEFAFLEDPHFILPELSYFFEEIEHPKRDSIVRPLSKICERVCIGFYSKKPDKLSASFSSDQRTKLVEAAFDWLINDFRTAVKVKAMNCLFHLGTEFSWVHPELRVILSEQMHTESPGYRNRAVKILAKLGSVQKNIH